MLIDPGTQQLHPTILAPSLSQSYLPHCSSTSGNWAVFDQLLISTLKEKKSLPCIRKTHKNIVSLPILACCPEMGCLKSSTSFDSRHSQVVILKDKTRSNYCQLFISTSFASYGRHSEESYGCGSHSGEESWDILCCQCLFCGQCCDCPPVALCPRSPTVSPSPTPSLLFSILLPKYFKWSDCLFGKPLYIQNKQFLLIWERMDILTSYPSLDKTTAVFSSADVVGLYTKER